MLTLKHDILLELSVVDLLVLNELILPYYLNSIQLFVLLKLREVDLTEGSFSDLTFDLEVFKTWWLEYFTILIIFFDVDAYGALHVGCKLLIEKVFCFRRFG